MCPIRSFFPYIRTDRHIKDNSHFSHFYEYIKISQALYTEDNFCVTFEILSNFSSGVSKDFIAKIILLVTSTSNKF